MILSFKVSCFSPPVCVIIWLSSGGRQPGNRSGYMCIFVYVCIYAYIYLSNLNLIYDPFVRDIYIQIIFYLNNLKLINDTFVYLIFFVSSLFWFHTRVCPLFKSLKYQWSSVILSFWLKYMMKIFIVEEELKLVFHFAQ